MPDVRMSLTEAAAALGVAPNSVRSRYKAGKLRGERDNAGKIWVWIDPAAQSSKILRSKLSIEASSKPSIEGQVRALQDHIETLKIDLAVARAERDSLGTKASLADQLNAEIEGLKAARDQMREAISAKEEVIADLRIDRDNWQAQADRAIKLLSEPIKSIKGEKQEKWWKRLVG